MGRRKRRRAKGCSGRSAADCKKVKKCTWVPKKKLCRLSKKKKKSAK